MSVLFIESYKMIETLNKTKKYINDTLFYGAMNALKITKRIPYSDIVLEKSGEYTKLNKILTSDDFLRKILSAYLSIKHGGVVSITEEDLPCIDSIDRVIDYAKHGDGRIAFLTWGRDKVNKEWHKTHKGEKEETDSKKGIQNLLVV